MNYPKYSVTISVYKNDNREFFDLALKSIFSQTVPPSEVVITVDGEVGCEIESVIEKYMKLRETKVIRWNKNCGLGVAHNRGVLECGNELVGIMDADDICVKDRFQKQLSYFIEHEDVDILGGQIEEFTGTPDNVVGKRAVPLSDREIKRYFKSRCPMNHMSIMFKKSAVISSGNYRDWYLDEDYFLYARMMKNNATFQNLPDVLVKVRVGEEMYERRGGWKYFLSEVKLQKWMWSNHLTSFPRYIFNVLVRLAVEVAIPNKFRSFLFQKFFRKSGKGRKKDEK